MMQQKSLRWRHFKSSAFLWLCRGAVTVTIGFLIFFLFDIARTAAPAFWQTYVKVEVNYTEKAAQSGRHAIDRSYRKIVSRTWLRTIPLMLEDNPELVNTKQEIWVVADDQVDQFLKGHHNNLKEKDRAFVKLLHERGDLELRWNDIFFTHGDSKAPEASGIASAIVGSILTLFVTMLIAFPLGVMTAVYLEEFAKDTPVSRFVEVNINNLAAIPSILYGLLGLSVFINLFGLPRSSPLVGGMTLALMTLPIIIVSSRAALRSVPEKVRQAGYGLGISKLDVVKDHVLPVAMPGILTGSIIGLAQAMGETAPLIIIGMIAFIPDTPTSIFEAATVLPAQVFTWAGLPERAYVERTAAGIVVILTTLVFMNASAIYLRKKYETQW